MNLVLPVFGDNAKMYNIYSINDSSNGGTTESFMYKEGEETILVCDIYPDNSTYSFCEIAIEISGDKSGVDLSIYDAITVDLGYFDNTDAKVRLQTKNRNPAYSVSTDFTSDKFNILEFNPATEGNRITIPLSYFQVPEWWISQYNVPIEHSQPEFSNTVIIEISVASNTPPGSYELWVKELTFHGKLISYTQLISGIMFFWLAIAIVSLIASVIKVSVAFRQKQKQILELNALNKSLNVYSKKMEQQAKTDPLTGVYNRNGVTSSLLEFQANVRGQSSRFSVIFCDIDLFKLVNDTHGHSVGDQVIIKVASLLQACTRADDLVVRWGGEEFVLFCPHTPLESAAVLAEKLRATIEQAKWPNDLNLTASFGVAQMEPTEDITHFLNRADQSLYRAKGNGRNRVEINRDDVSKGKAA